jgi:CRP-like cAMP-binding protein/Fe-S-cluster-containing hydrogenase component 2
MEQPQAAAYGGGEPQRKPNISVSPDAELVPIERLKQYPFLSTCSDIVLKKLQPQFAERDYEPGATILELGGYSDAAYYIASGVVGVRVTPVTAARRDARAAESAPAPPSMADRLRSILGRKGAEQAVQRPRVSMDGTIMLADLPIDLRANEEVLLEAGEVFGEMSALSRYPISADVIARSDVTCLLIRTAGLRLMFKQKELAPFKKMIDDRYRRRTLANHLRNVSLFGGLNDGAIGSLREKAELVSFEPGKVIVEQGAKADAFYLVRGGFVKVAVKAGEADAAVTYLGKGDYAGEIALLLDEPWPFSLFALEHVEIVKIPRADFQAILSTYPEVQRQLWAAAVERLKARGTVTREPLTSRYLQMAMDTGLIHGESVLLIDLTTCTRCDDCVRGCAETHGGVPRFIREGHKFRTWSVPTSCYQCTDPVCMIGCPTGAITRPLGTLEVTINKDTCIGCSNCVRRCPWGNIVEVPYHSPTLNREINLATKCDLCLGRPQGPACVQSCPHGSAVRISFKDLPAVSRTLSP